MNRMSIELAIETVRTAVQEAVSTFVGEKISPQSISAINARVLYILEDLRNRGIVPSYAPIPVIDVNHEKEISHLNGKLRLLNESLCEVDYTDDKWREINNEIAMTVWKRDGLKRQITSPHSMTVFFKNEDFSLVDWRKLYE
jgi:hypothetical protein